MLTKKNVRILVVDDDSEIRGTLTELIKLMGHDVATADNGQSALELLNTGEYEMILTDVQMPVMSGLELFETVKSRNIPVVLMTGFSSLVDLNKATAMGAADFLSKPFSADELRNSIRLATQSALDGERTPEEVEADYVRVHVPDYIGLGKTALDIFARTPEGAFARVARADNPQTQYRLQGFVEKGLRFLYIRKEDYALQMGFHLKQARSTPAARKPCSITEKMRFLRDVIQNDLEQTYSPAVARDAFEFAKCSVEAALQMCIENDVLYQLLFSYRQQHPQAFTRSLGVAAYSVLGAKQVGWNAHHSIFKTAMAGVLHDIGKVDIPAEIIQRRRQGLSVPEQAIYESHAHRGRDLLREMPFITEEVIQAVANHHENNSGTGFPMRLSRLKIHPLAKMLHFVDAFCDEMLADQADHLMNPMQVFLAVYPDHEDDFEPAFVRAVLEIFRIPMPEKLRKLQSTLDAK